MRKKAKPRANIRNEVAKLRIELAERKLLETQTEWTFNRIKSERWKLDTIFNCLPNGVRIITGNHIVKFQNRWITEKFGNQTDDICYKKMFNRETPCPGCLVRRALSENSVIVGEYRLIEDRYYEIVAAPLGEFEDALCGIEIMIDVTEHKKSEDEVLKTRQRYADLINNLNVGVYRSLADPEAHFLEVNASMVDMFEADSREALMAVKIRELYRNPQDRDKLASKLNRRGFVRGEEIEFRSMKGKFFWASATAVKKTDASGNVVFDGIIEDITERRLANEEIERLNRELKKTNDRLRRAAFRDEETGLYNRRYLEDMVEIEFARSQRYGQPFTLLILEISSFIRVAEQFGDGIAINLIKKIAAQLRPVVRQCDILTRSGIKEFTLLLPRTDDAEAGILLQRIGQNLQKLNCGSWKKPEPPEFRAAVISYPKQKADKGIELLRLAGRVFLNLKPQTPGEN